MITNNKTPITSLPTRILEQRQTHNKVNNLRLDKLKGIKTK